ncbi:magnesium transporter [Spirochaetota bacterium]
MLEKLIATDLREAIAQNDLDGVTAFFSNNHPVDSAEILEALEPEDALEILNTLDAGLKADIFSEFSTAFQTEMAELLDKASLAKLAADLEPDDRVDLIKTLPEQDVMDILASLPHADRMDIQHLASYEEGTAGSIMTSDYIALKADLSVSAAMAQIRKEAPKKESIYNNYIVDGDNKLIGKATLRDLILAEPDTKLADIMDDQVYSVESGQSREEAVYKLSHYDLIDLPVLNDAGVMVGIITHDDAMDALEDEHTEDMERFMAISGKKEDKTYLQTSALSHFRYRVFWLVALAAFGLVSGAVLQSFEHTLSTLMILAFYMPMLADTGGNTGSQSATVIIRALSLKEIGTKDALKVISKELAVSLMLGAILGILAFARVMFFTRAGTVPESLSMINIAISIAASLSLQVISSTVIGAALPLLAHKLRLDPALVASPMLTTIVDITGLLIYFNVARLLLRI